MDTMFIKTMSFVLFLIDVSYTYPCGPGLRCSCASLGEKGSRMDCRRKGLKKLSDICDNLGNVTQLDASYNKISGILKDDLCGCKNLHSLILRNNSISGIISESFRHLQELIELDLSNNILDIYTNGSGALRYLHRLKTLKLNGNYDDKSELTHKYPDLSANRNLVTLYIDGLELGYFDKPYKYLLHLKVLNISGSSGVCKLSYVNDGFFTNLKYIQVVNMSYCLIRHIEFNVFTITTYLTHLDLAYNQNLGLRALYNISHGLQFTNIYMLNFSHVINVFGLGTQITKQDLCFLSNTSSLHELVLNGNRIQLFETNSLILMPQSLNIIHVEDNIFTFGPYLLQVACPSNVTDLYANFQNKAHYFKLYNPSDMISEPKMNYTGYCPFQSDTYLKQRSKMIENCHYYEPDEKPDYVPTIPQKTERIYFTDSNIRYRVSKVVVIPLFNSVNYIDVSGNNLHELNGPMGPAPNLKYLDASRNYCTRIGEKFFEYGTFIETLQIHSNFLGLNMSKYSYNGAFHYLINLQIMNLSMNKITTLHPKLLEGLASLQTLDLSLNSIEEWTLEVNSLKSLSKLLLKSNSLSSLPYSVMNHLDNVAERIGQDNISVDLSNNILRYGCNTQQFLEWLIKHRSSFIGFNEYLFVDDNGQPIKNEDIVSKVRALDKQCRSYTMWIVISTIGVSIALSVVIGGLLYKNRWKIRYFMYMSKQRFYGYIRVPNQTPIENYKYDAFISYAEENIRFVKDQIIPNVEQGGASLCIHQRDFMPGNAIADNIIDAIKSSRKTIVLLTEAFLKRKWCIYEFNMARMESIYSRDGRSCLLIVMLENVPTKHMPLEMVEWIKNESYLEYTTEGNGEALFWNNLIETVRA